MRTALFVLIACAALDVVACGLLLLLVWVEHRRQRREAVARGEQPPPPATGQFVILGLILVAGLCGLYAGLSFLLGT
jgi:hypothetical protein